MDFATVILKPCGRRQPMAWKNSKPLSIKLGK